MIKMPGCRSSSGPLLIWHIDQMLQMQEHWMLMLPTPNFSTLSYKNHSLQLLTPAFYNKCSSSKGRTNRYRRMNEEHQIQSMAFLYILMQNKYNLQIAYPGQRHFFADAPKWSIFSQSQGWTFSKSATRSFHLGWLSGVDLGWHGDVLVESFNLKMFVVVFWSLGWDLWALFPSGESGVEHWTQILWVKM